MPKVIIESFGKLTGRVIEGIALTPAVSLNRNIYSAEAIDTAKNLDVVLPADWEHTEEKVGTVVYSKGENHSIKYRAEITTERSKELKEGVHKVSIEADIDEVVSSCNRKGCYNLVDGITFEGIGITTNPGVQTTTLNIIESSQDWPVMESTHCEKCTLKINEEEQNNIQVEIDNLKKQVEYLSRPKCEKCNKPKKI